MNQDALWRLKIWIDKMRKRGQHLIFTLPKCLKLNWKPYYLLVFSVGHYSACLHCASRVLWLFVSNMHICLVANTTQARGENNDFSNSIMDTCGAEIIRLRRNETGSLLLLSSRFLQRCCCILTTLLKLTLINVKWDSWRKRTEQVSKSQQFHQKQPCFVFFNYSACFPVWLASGVTWFLIKFYDEVQLSLSNWPVMLLFPFEYVCVCGWTNVFVQQLSGQCCPEMAVPEKFQGRSSQTSRGCGYQSLIVMLVSLYGANEADPERKGSLSL